MLLYLMTSSAPAVCFDLTVHNISSEYSEYKCESIDNKESKVLWSDEGRLEEAFSSRLLSRSAEHHQCRITAQSEHTHTRQVLVHLQ